MPQMIDVSKPEERVKWSRHFERFRHASALTIKTEKRKVNTLIYTIGSEADDILSSFNLSVKDKKKYDVAKANLDNYFVKRRNIINE